MCLSIPGKILSIGEYGRAEVDVGGVQRTVDLTLVPEAVVGDYVLVHVGFAIERVDEAEASETLALLRQLAESVDEVR